MDKFGLDGQVLSFVFKRLRLQEGRKLGKITSLINDVTIFKILINAKYKQENDIILSDLEERVRQEIGNNIIAYVSQKYDEIKRKEQFKAIPYLETTNKTIRDIEKQNKINSERNMFRIKIA